MRPNGAVGGDAASVGAPRRARSAVALGEVLGSDGRRSADDRLHLGVGRVLDLMSQPRAVTKRVK